MGSILFQFVRLAILVVEAIIAARIILHVLGADPQATFTRFMYGVSGGLVSPFNAGGHPVFAPANVNGHPFEWSSLLAMGVYAVMAYLVVAIGRIAGRMLRAAFSTSPSSY